MYSPPPASCPLLVFASRPFVSKRTRNQTPSHQKVADDPPAQAARNTAQALFRSLLMALDPVQQRVCCGRLMSQGRTHGITILLAMAFLATLHASSSPVPQTACLSQHRARRPQQHQGLRAIKRSRCTVRCPRPAGISRCPRLGGQRDATIKTPRLVNTVTAVGCSGHPPNPPITPPWAAMLLLACRRCEAFPRLRSFHAALAAPHCARSLATCGSTTRA